MVSFNVYRATSSGAYIEGVCLASDEKPIVGISNGSILYAVDASDGTTTRYMFDQSTASWIEAECPCSGSGSGGSSGGDSSLLIINGTEGTLDKTWRQIYDHVLNGGMAIVSGTNAVSIVISAYHDGEYYIAAGYASYTASNENGYPELSGE